MLNAGEEESPIKLEAYIKDDLAKNENYIFCEELLVCYCFYS